MTGLHLKVSVAYEQESLFAVYIGLLIAYFFLLQELPTFSFLSFEKGFIGFLFSIFILVSFVSWKKDTSRVT